MNLDKHRVGEWGHKRVEEWKSGRTTEEKNRRFFHSSIREGRGGGRGVVTVQDKGKLVIFVVTLTFIFTGPGVVLASSGEGMDLGTLLPLWSVVPFIGILLSIALLPLFLPHFWHDHYGKVAAGWAILFAVPFVIAYGHQAFHEILHVFIIDYIPFIILLWSLFTVAGGIVVKGSLRGTPAVNTMMLLIGTVIASWVGTTGASMLLIRPVIRANYHRKSMVHVVIFFIFLVSNIGGSLTPLGDPPLFLGFLHGVPFFWTFKILPHMAFVSLLTLVVFYLLDSFLYRKESQASTVGQTIEPFGVEGLYNLFFLAGIVGAVLMSGVVKLGHVTLAGIEVEKQNLLRDALMIVMGLLSLRLTSPLLRDENDFTWGPIKEVAYLFAGIFMCIIPALAILRAGTEGALRFVIEAVQEPWHYFWITGGLSSFLDNAPTYLTFMNTALGNFFPGMAEHEAVHALTTEKAIYLQAVSAGAVFMGANTYIGNAPNFMVKSIAEQFEIAMPSFFGYMVYSLSILIPLFVIATFVFF
jgi:Na+/H+ antiporter NhaD/arsenite permease-like protein